MARAQKIDPNMNNANKGAGTAGTKGAAPVSMSGTAERDEVYGLVSVLYHSLQAAETMGQYLEDARQSGDQELVSFFEDCRSESNDRARSTKAMLESRLEGDDEGDDDDDDAEQDQEE